MSFQLLKRTLSSALFLVFACFINQKITAQPRPSEVATIYTLTVTAAQPDTRVTLAEKTVMKGEFKIPDLGKVEAYEEGTFVIKVTDRNGKEVYETICNNPLDQHIEHVNAKGDLDRTHVQIAEDIISLRIPFDTQDHIVSIYAVKPNNRLALLTTL